MVPSPRARLAEPGLTAEMERKKAASMTRLQRAQQYRERTHLPRYYKSTDWPPRQIKCQPRTPHASSQLFDVWKDNIHPSFGIGVSSYFRLLRKHWIARSLCGIINIPSASYYHSRGYSSVKYAAVKEHSAFEINERKQNSYLLANTALCGNYIRFALTAAAQDIQQIVMKMNIGRKFVSKNIPSAMNTREKFKNLQIQISFRRVQN